MSNLSTLTRDDGLAQLSSILGPQYLHREGDIFVATPADKQQIAEVLRLAVARNLVVTPVGGGTKQGWGNRVEANIHLNLSRLNTIREHAWQDMTCIVEAGTTWADLQAALKTHNQMVALDPLWPDRATVGGITASNDSGAMRLKYGGLRDLIIGMTVVLADGTIAKSGGKVVKNVAGYDLHKLMTGSFGTLAVLTEVNFRLHPVEQHAFTWSIIAPDAQHSGDAAFARELRSILDLPITPTSIQLRCRRNESILDLRIASTPESLDEYALRLKSLFGEQRVLDSPDTVWQARERLFDRKDSVLLKVSAPQSQVCSLSSEMQKASNCDLEVSSVAQANGLLTVELNGNMSLAAEMIQLLRQRVLPCGGSVVVQQLPDGLRDRIEIWGPTSNPLPLMKEIKRLFDPGRTLNPGRFVGNI
jgi:glycolate oxidase FAD binding subunit